MKFKNICKNMSVIYTADGEDGGEFEMLYSYQTPVAMHLPGEGFFRTDKNWGATTSKHINKWLDGNTAETRPQEFFENVLEANLNLLEGWQ